MPYSYPNDLPACVDGLLAGAQKLFVAAFNSEFEKSSDDVSAIKAGWGAVKSKYKKSGGNWVKKTLSVQIDALIKSSDKLPDDLLELPGQLPTVWSMLFNQLVRKGMSVPTARDVAWSNIKKYVFWNGSRSRWIFKKLKPEEKILMEAISNETSNKGEGMSYKKHQIFKDGGKAGKFKLFVPVHITKSVDDEDGKLYLKGMASANVVDREDDMMMPEFIKKMRDVAVKLPAFIDHIRKDSHIIGKVVGLETDNEEIFDPITQLENPEDNALVKRMVGRMEDGITYGYSIGGTISKAVKTFDKELGRFIRKIYDGDIFELSVVPVPALEGTDVFLFKKEFDDSVFVDFASDDFEFAKTIGIVDVDEMVVVSDAIAKSQIAESEWSELFWFMFEKAVDKFAVRSSIQPEVESIDPNFVNKSCFLSNEGDESEWKYLYKYIPAGKSFPVIHYAALDKSYLEATQGNDKVMIEKIETLRKNLDIGEMEYQFFNFRKVLQATIQEAVNAKDARSTMWDILYEYQNAVELVVMYSEENKEQKIVDLTTLTEQLVEALDSLADTMARDTVVMLRSLAF